MTGFFKHCGFTAYAEEQTRERLFYIPMERMISPSQVKPQERRIGWLWALSLRPLLIVLLVVCGVFSAGK